MRNFHSHFLAGETISLSSNFIEVIQTHKTPIAPLIEKIENTEDLLQVKSVSNHLNQFFYELENIEGLWPEKCLRDPSLEAKSAEKLFLPAQHFYRIEFDENFVFIKNKEGIVASFRSKYPDEEAFSIKQISGIRSLAAFNVRFNLRFLSYS